MPGKDASVWTCGFRWLAPYLTAPSEQNNWTPRRSVVWQDCAETKGHEGPHRSLSNVIAARVPGGEDVSEPEGLADPVDGASLSCSGLTEDGMAAFGNDAAHSGSLASLLPGGEDT